MAANSELGFGAFMRWGALAAILHVGGSWCVLPASAIASEEATKHPIYRPGEEAPNDHDAAGLNDGEFHRLYLAAAPVRAGTANPSGAAASCAPQTIYDKEASQSGGAGNKKKIVLRVTVAHDVFGSGALCTGWSIRYSVKALKKNFWGNWVAETSGPLWDANASFSYKLGSTGVPQSVSYYKNLQGMNSYSADLAQGLWYSPLSPPMFISGGTVTSSRLGGSSGITVTWTAP